eukprot:2448202-Rhodomonas_salina.4
MCVLRLLPRGLRGGRTRTRGALPVEPPPRRLRAQGPLRARPGPGAVYGRTAAVYGGFGAVYGGDLVLFMEATWCGVWRRFGAVYGV